MRRQRAVLQLPEKFRLREAALQLVFHRALADHDLGARQIERQERVEVFFDGDAPEADEDRPRKARIDGAIGPKQFGVDAARPHAEIGKAALAQFAHQ